MIPIDYLDEFVTECQTLGMTPHTIESYTSNLRLFFEYVEGISYDQVKTPHLAKFLNYLRHEKEVRYRGSTKKGCSKSTIKTYFSALISYYDFLEFSGKYDHNPVIRFRKRYLRHIKKDGGPENIRQLISVRDMAKLVYTTDDLTQRAVLITLAKTGVRRHELIALDLKDLNLNTGVIYLKPAAKRSNRIVFVDDEALSIIKKYLNHRKNVSSKALFTSVQGRRLNKNRVYEIVTRNAERLNYHNPEGLLIEKFTPHCCRHWFTTHLSRAGMSREFMQYLRGDVIHDAIDIYNHIDPEAVRLDYRTRAPQLKEALLFE